MRKLTCRSWRVLTLRERCSCSGRSARRSAGVRLCLKRLPGSSLRGAAGTSAGANISCRDACRHTPSQLRGLLQDTKGVLVSSGGLPTCSRKASAAAELPRAPLRGRLRHFLPSTPNALSLLTRLRGAWPAGIVARLGSPSARVPQSRPPFVRQVCTPTPPAALLDPAPWQGLLRALVSGPDRACCQCSACI